MEDELKEKLKAGNTFPIIVVSATIIVAVLLGFFVIKPLYEDNKKQVKIKDIKKSNLDILKAKQKTLESFSSQEDDIKNNAKIVSDAYPLYKDKGRIFVQLETIAADTSLKLAELKEENSNVDIAPVSTDQTVITDAPPAGASEMQYTINLKGYYSGLQGFLTKAQDAIRLMKINGVEIKKADDGSLNIIIKASIFYRTEGEGNEK